MSWKAVALALFLVCTFTGLCLAEDRVLILGISQYQDSRIPTLPGINKDVESARKIALSMGFKSSQIKVLTNSAVTLEGIRQAVERWLIAGVKADDRVLFYFSGHGSRVREGNEVREVIVTYDTRIGAENLENIFKAYELRDLLARTPSQKALIIIDACHSERLTQKSAEAGAPNEVVPKVLNYPGMPDSKDVAARTKDGSTLWFKGLAASPGLKVIANNLVLLAACKDDEEAGATEKGSIFTVALRDAVDRLKNEKQQFTAERAESIVTDLVLREPGANQHPQVFTTNSQLLTVNWFKDGAAASAWELLEKVADDAASPVQLALNHSGNQSETKVEYRVGDSMQVRCDIPRDGYLNILELGEGDETPMVLFPNQYNPDNSVRSGSLVVPTPGQHRFSIRQALPANMNLQKNLLVVIFTEAPLNLFRDGSGDGPFRSLKVTRSSVVVSEQETYAASKIYFDIKR
jgi:hypothetical protein